MGSSPQRREGAKDAKKRQLQMFDEAANIRLKNN
jgi:hypothetical protein